MAAGWLGRCRLWTCCGATRQVTSGISLGRPANSAQTQEFEARHGVAARLAGALSFVNLLWGGAILGITVSVGPTLAIVCAPAFEVSTPTKSNM